MNEPRDEIDSWLSRDVELLPPGPGTFEQLRRRARRRKARQAVVASGGAAVVIAAAVLAPQLVSSLQPGGGPAQRPAAASGLPSARPSPSTTAAPSASAVPVPQPSATVPGPASPAVSPGTSLVSGGPVPANFQPTSITMIGNTGAVIGQAGTPGHCYSAYCTSLAATNNYGSSWHGVSAPHTGPPDGAAGVSQLRFLTTLDGWAYGPALWMTTDGGMTWRQQDTFGLRVTGLETAGNGALAIMARCSGTGGNYAASCTGFSLFATTAGGAGWQPVPGPVSNLTAAGGGPSSAGLVIAPPATAVPGAPAVSGAPVGYLLAPSGMLLNGPVSGAPWRAVGALPSGCQPGLAQSSGEPTGAQLAAGSPQAGTASPAAASFRLILSCNGPEVHASTQVKNIFVSADGISWQPKAAAPSAGAATSLAASSGGLAILATTSGLDYSADGGASWHPAASGPALGGGFSYVGMTTSRQGVAVPTYAVPGDVFRTGDGGLTWTASPIRGNGS